MDDCCCAILDEWGQLQKSMLLGCSDLSDYVIGTIGK